MWSGATVSNTFFCCTRVRRHSSCQFSHEYTDGTPTCISFPEGPLLGGLDLAINGSRPHTPTLTFDGFSLSRRNDGELRANLLRMCASLRICAFFGIILQFRPHSPPRHNVKNQPVTRSCNAGRTPSKDSTCPLTQARSEPIVHAGVALDHVRGLRAKENCRAYSKYDPLQ